MESIKKTIEVKDECCAHFQNEICSMKEKVEDKTPCSRAD
jgi:hypothetical protein